MTDSEVSEQEASSSRATTSCSGRNVLLANLRLQKKLQELSFDAFETAGCYDYIAEGKHMSSIKEYSFTS